MNEIVWVVGDGELHIFIAVLRYSKRGINLEDFSWYELIILCRKTEICLSCGCVHGVKTD